MLLNLPQGYEGGSMHLSSENVVLLMAGNLPVLWLDEQAMQWRVLDRHVSQVAKEASA